MAARESEDSDIQAVKMLRELVLREAREQDVAEIAYQEKREFAAGLLDRNVINFWISGTRDVKAAYQSAEPEAILNMQLIREIDQSAIVVKNRPGLLSWMNGTFIITANRDAHEKLVRLIADIIRQDARDFVMADATIEPITPSFMMSYWSALRSYLEIRKAWIDARKKVEAAMSLVSAAQNIEAAYAAGVAGISAQVLAEAKRWPTEHQLLKKAESKLSSDCETAYMKAVTMADGTARCVYNSLANPLC
jgi:hypothetical protein